MDGLQSKVAKLHRARMALQEVSERITRARTEWEATQDANFLMQQEAREAVNVLEAEVKHIRIETFDGETKTPLYGIGIREVSKLDYSDDAAYLWALSHQLALKLDKKEFEKIAKATPLYFVNVVTEPQATIARDLSDWADENVEELPF